MLVTSSTGVTLAAVVLLISTHGWLDLALIYKHTHTPPRTGIFLSFFCVCWEQGIYTKWDCRNSQHLQGSTRLSEAERRVVADRDYQQHPRTREGHGVPYIHGIVYTPHVGGEAGGCECRRRGYVHDSLCQLERAAVCLFLMPIPSFIGYHLNCNGIRRPRPRFISEGLHCVFLLLFDFFFWTTSIYWLMRQCFFFFFPGRALHHHNIAPPGDRFPASCSKKNRKIPIPDECQRRKLQEIASPHSGKC